MTFLALRGCRATPLLSYLQTLGVLRILHEQRAPELTSYWNGSTLHIKSNLSPEAITRFFVEDYQPTPMLSPWNGGGGFRTLKHEKGEQAVVQIESSHDSRFASFRAAIGEARRTWERGRTRWLARREVGREDRRKEEVHPQSGQDDLPCGMSSCLP